ncbi:MAG TPA: glycosyltransferase, partial [Chitinophagaceae bacterium]|nr:glycosyltransferase [Chitinophagaceae bacterium]
LKSNYNLPDLKLLIAGEFYEDEKNYDELLNDPAIKDGLILHTHFISDSEVKYYLCAADCVIQPYRSATQSGVTPLAYHFEKPMIVTRVGGLPEIVPDNKVGFVTEVDPRAITEAILRFYKEDKAAGFAANLKAEKRKYSWTYFTDNIMSLYQQIREKGRDELR